MAKLARKKLNQGQLKARAAGRAANVKKVRSRQNKDLDERLERLLVFRNEF